MKKLLILLFVLFAALVSLFAYQAGSKKQETPLASASPIVQNSEVRSSEGDKKLKMSAKENLDGTISYSFSVPDSLGKSQLIFAKTVGKGASMALPQNSWSPNSKYFFIEDREAGGVDYLVFKVNGEPFLSGEKYLNVTFLFAEKVKNYNLKAITGWDDPVLVHVLTVKGPPFWFEITSQSFIQLVR